MRRVKTITGAVAGGLTSLAVIGLFYLGQQLFDLPLVPFDIFDWLARMLPGDVITLGIDAIVKIVDTLNLGSTSQSAKLIEQLSAAALFVGIGIVLGLLVGLVSSRVTRSAKQLGLIGGALLLAILFIVEITLTSTTVSIGSILWMAAVLLTWGFSIGAVVDSVGAPTVDESDQAGRRAVLLRVAAGSIGIAAGSWGLSWLLGSRESNSGAAQPLAQATPAPTITPVATPSVMATAAVTTRDEIKPAPGTRTELTATEDFYRIDINTFTPVLKEFEWELQVEGLFDSPRTLTLKDLMEYPVVTQPITLSCISNRIGGDLIGTSNWTGLRLRDLLEDLGIQRSAQELMVEAADGFFESVTMMDMMDPRTLLVYGMNGKTLPTNHGYPLRVYIPNRYGMKQPKWITKITAIDHEGTGYWVERGWSKTAHPQIVSVIDSVAVKEVTPDGRIPIGGIAWAGDRGIQQVDLQFDDGEWVPALLRVPPLSPLTWVQWRYDWDAQPGKHTIRVRAVDGTGASQIEKETGVRPDGATGYHSVDVSI